MPPIMDNAGVDRPVPDFVSGLFEAHRSRLVNYARQFLVSPEDAADVVQEAYLRAWRHRERLEPATAPAWLRTVVRRLCIDRLRRMGLVDFIPIQHEAPATLPADFETPEHLVVRQETRRLVHRVLPLLLDRHVLALALYYDSELTCEQMAAVMGCTHSSAKTTLFRARIAFRKAAERSDVASAMRAAS